MASRARTTTVPQNVDLTALMRGPGCKAHARNAVARRTEPYFT